VGFILVVSGQLRVFTVSDEGRELTLYRLFDRDMCLFSASCVMRNIQFDVMVSAERDSDVLVIPPDVYKRLMEESAAVANYTNDLTASHFSDVMWLMDQILNKSWTPGCQPFFWRRAPWRARKLFPSPTSRSRDIWAPSARWSPAC
jgi:CRP/FNR family transcriptional regulator